MSYLNAERPPSKWDSAWFKKFVERLRTSVNYINEDNLPDGLHGGLLLNRSVAIGKLAGFDIRHTIIASADTVSVTSVSPVTKGGAYTWSPGAWGGANSVSVYLEVVGATSHESSPAVFTLEGADGLIATLTTTSTSLTTLRSPELTMPVASQTILFKMNATLSGKSAGLVSAHIIITPKVTQ